MSRTDRRVVLYSHDTMGLGHMRRNLLIAQSLAASGRVQAILLIAGAQEAGAFLMPPGVDCLTLPSLQKRNNGRYQPRHLDIATEALIALRRKTIHATVAAFEPEVLIVDKVPRGAMGELDATLEYLRARGRTRCVLGLRDVLDEPSAVAEEWRASANEQAIDDYYDAIWVYGQRQVYDVAREYRFSSAVTRKIRYVGYLDPRSRYSSDRRDVACPCADWDLSCTCTPHDRAREFADPPMPSAKLVLCQVGGGEDGILLAENFVRAQLPPGSRGVIVTGPFMPSAARHRLRCHAAANPTLEVVEFLREPEHLLRRADRVVTMGGYNNICELLAFGKRSLVVPRIQPRQEQLIRASRLAELGLIEMLHPDALTPHALSDWLAQEPQKTAARFILDFGGLARLPHLLHGLPTDRAAALEPVSSGAGAYVSLQAD